ncbi:hypothetical protein Pmani_034099 [Petrolisthes manimaculis]|uniref:Uncharacterized protein n=1 Tax=Petrolisthes manimaculis TaxID=1843537 RepID=A0AAE1TS13_9EUCA|nr:hypothetical protein Pmani_034099 [Petrolisthes manimaculis]
MKEEEKEEEEEEVKEEVKEEEKEMEENEEEEEEEVDLYPLIKTDWRRKCAPKHSTQQNSAGVSCLLKEVG